MYFFLFLKEKVKLFNEQKKLRYERKGSDLTNQQKIGFFTFLAFNEYQDRLFHDIDDHFKCAINIHFCKTTFEDFFVQHAIENHAEMYPKVGSFCKLLSEKNYRRFNFKYSTNVAKRYFGGTLKRITFDEGAKVPTNIEPNRLNFEVLFNIFNVHLHIF